MSKHDYFLQKGLQMQRLDEQISATPVGGNALREVAKYRELCPPATPDGQIQKLIGQCKGDAQRMENVISELWEDYRGNDQDVWATVSKKNTKKKHEQSHNSSHRSYSKTKNQENLGDVTQDGDTQLSRSPERFSTRGRGSMRGHRSVSSRGGRSGRGGRGRGGAIVATGSTRGPRTGDNEEESPENDTNSTDTFYEAQSSKTAKDSKSERGAKPINKTTTTQSAAQAPPVVYPVLTGAWTKKLNVSSVTSTPKPVEPNFTPATASLPTLEVPTKHLEKSNLSASDTDIAVNVDAEETPKAASPKKKIQQEKKSKNTQKSRSTIAVKEPVAVDKSVNRPLETVEKVTSPRTSPKKMVEMKTNIVETTVEATSSNIAAGWGALDVANSTINEWSASVPVASTDSKKASTSSAWARGSPVLSPPVSKIVTPAPKSPAAETRPTVVPGSPKDLEAPRSTGSASTSPRPYLKMGKWDSATAPNLSLQFGSFSLNGVETHEPSSPVGWSSTTKTTTTTSSNKGGKSVTKTTTASSGWGTATKPVSPQKTLSPDHSEQQQRSQEKSIVKTSSSAPPGLSVDSGRVTPTTSQSPRYAPSAPSPASLPKPDEVKRATPTRAHGGPFQAQGGATTQANKMNIGYGTGLYQASYGQYSMDLGRSSTTSTPSQLSAGSGTPKATSARGGAVAQVAAQSPSRGQQPVTQIQQVPLQQQAQQQQQQQQVQQQTQQKQVQQQQIHQVQQSQQNPAQQQTAAQMHQQAQAGMQQGYHYAPPPPPGMALPYNPYNYAGYYQGYGYYQNPQFTQYSPRTQYPPRGSMPYGVEGPVPGFSNPPNMPYQDQHMMAQQHEYAGALPQGFGEINAAYMQQAPMQQQGGHLGHHGHQNGPQSHGKGGSGSSVISQQSHGQRGNASIQGYGTAGGREHVTPPVPNVSAAMTGSYNQHYGWAGNYGAQPVGGWGHMMPQGYQQSPSQQQQQQAPQQQQQQQQQNVHQQSYHQYGNSGAQTGSNSNDVNQTRWSSS